MTAYFADIATENDRKELFKELRLMANVGDHPNIVNLVGACSRGGTKSVDGYDSSSCLITPRLDFLYCGLSKFLIQICKMLLKSLLRITVLMFCLHHKY